MTTFSFDLIAHSNFLQLNLQGALLDKQQATTLLEDVEDSIEEGNHYFLLDFSALEYLNSSGLAVVLGILARARKAGGDVAIAGTNSKLNKLLVMTRLDQVFAKLQNTEQAQKLFEEIQNSTSKHKPENGH